MSISRRSVLLSILAAPLAALGIKVGAREKVADTITDGLTSQPPYSFDPANVRVFEVEDHAYIEINGVRHRAVDYIGHVYRVTAGPNGDTIMVEGEAIHLKPNEVRTFKHEGYGNAYTLE